MIKNKNLKKIRKTVLVFIIAIFYCIFLSNFVYAVTNCGLNSCGSGINNCNDPYHCSNTCYNCYQQHVNTAGCRQYAVGMVKCFIDSCKDSYANADGEWSNGCELKVACGNDSDCNTSGLCQVNPGHCINGNTINAQCSYDSVVLKNISDTSGNANNGQVFCASSVAGKIGQGFSFNGVLSYAVIPDSSFLKLSNKFAISAWVYRTKSAGTWERIVSKSDINDYDYWLQIDAASKIQIGVKKSDGNIAYLDGNSAIPLNTWTHIVTIKNESGFAIYINDVLDNSGFSFGTLGNAKISSASLQIGRLGSAGKWYYNFTGIIDELKIWNFSLTENEIKSEYENGNISLANNCAPGENKILENPSVKLNCLETSKSVSGNDLTINWAINLKNNLAYGLYPVYPYAKDKMNQGNPLGHGLEKGNISLVSSLPNRAPTLLALTPVSGESYPNQEVNFSYGCSDADGVNDLIYCGLFIFSNDDTYPSIPVILYYYPNYNTLNILNETNNSIIAGNCTLGSNAIIENKNSRVDCSKVFVQKSVLGVSLNVPMVFKEAFAGKSYSIEPYAKDRAQPTNHRTYDIKGNWTVNIIPVNYPPIAGSVSPSNGEFFTDEESTFTTDYSDANGFSDIVSAYITIDSNLSDTQKIFVVYYPDSRIIEIRNNINNSKVDGNCTIGENKTIESYYTNLSCLNSGISGSGTILSFTLDFRFKEKIMGSRKIFIKVDDMNRTTSGWKEVGNITISKKTVFNCTDSDGGKNYNDKGITNGTNGVSIDSCINTTTLKEYYCGSSGATSFVYYKCSGKCSNGTCIEVKATTMTSTTSNKTSEADKSEVYGSTRPETTELEKTPVEGKTAGEIVLWSIIWSVSILFVIVFIYLIYSLNKKRALKKKLLSKMSTPIVRQIPPGFYRPLFRR